MLDRNSITSGNRLPTFHTLPEVEITPPPAWELVHAIACFMHEYQTVQILQAFADGSTALDPPSRMGSAGTDDALLSAVRREVQTFFAQHPTLDQHSLLITRDHACLLHISYAPEIRRAAQKSARRTEAKWWERGDGL